MLKAVGARPDDRARRDPAAVAELDRLGVIEPEFERVAQGHFHSFQGFAINDSDRAFHFMMLNCPGRRRHVQIRHLFLSSLSSLPRAAGKGGVVES